MTGELKALAAELMRLSSACSDHGSDIVDDGNEREISRFRGKAEAYLDAAGMVNRVLAAMMPVRTMRTDVTFEEES